MTEADTYFREEAKEILENGFSDEGYEVRPKWEDGTPAHTVKTFCRVNRYDLSKGEFPILTLRRAPFKYAVKETLWIFQKKSNDVRELGSRNWDSWADENGSIGKTYGYVAGEKYEYPEGFRDQVDDVLWHLTHDPMNRRMIIQLFRPEYVRQSGLPPCLCSYFFDVSYGKLNMTAIMRSADFLAAAGAGQSDEIGMAILLIIMARHANLIPGKLVVVKNNLHVYDRHIPIVREILSREPCEKPEVWVDPNIRNFYDFTEKSFELRGYSAKPLETKIPVAV